MIYKVKRFSKEERLGKSRRGLGRTTGLSHPLGVIDFAVGKHAAKKAAEDKTSSDAEVIKKASNAAYKSGLATGAIEAAIGLGATAAAGKAIKDNIPTISKAVGEGVKKAASSGAIKKVKSGGPQTGLLKKLTGWALKKEAAQLGKETERAINRNAEAAIKKYGKKTKRGLAVAGTALAAHHIIKSARKAENGALRNTTDRLEKKKEKK